MKKIEQNIKVKRFLFESYFQVQLFPKLSAEV